MPSATGTFALPRIEVVQEFLHIHAKRGRRSEAIDRAQAYMRLLAPLIVVEPADLEAGIRLFGEHERLGAFDALLAAVAIRRTDAIVVSADGGFRRIPGLTHVDPGDPSALTRLLGS